MKYPKKDTHDHQIQKILKAIQLNQMIDKMAKQIRKMEGSRKEILDGLDGKTVVSLREHSSWKKKDKELDDLKRILRETETKQMERPFERPQLPLDQSFGQERFSHSTFEQPLLDLPPLFEEDVF